MSERNKVIDVDSAGNENFNGLFGESIAEQRHDDVSVQFQYNYYDEQFDVDPELVTGDGVTTVANSLATVSSAAAGTAMRHSKDSIRYNPAHTGYSYMTASFNGAGIGRAGCFDDTDGFALQVSDGVASFGYLKDGVHKGSAGENGFDNETNWNGNLKVSKVDFTKLNIFMITFGYLGTANATLWIKKDKWYVLHTIKTEGVLTTTHVDTPVFPIMIEAINGMIVSSGSWCGGTIGLKSIAGLRGFGFPNQIVSGTAAISQGEALILQNTTKAIVIFHSKLLFHTKHNHVKARLTGYTFHVDVPPGVALGTIIFQVVGVQTLSGTPAYNDINTVSSVIEFDHVPGVGATVEVTAGVPSFTKNLEYVGANKGGNSADSEINAESIGAFAYEDNIFAIIAKNIGNADVNVRVTLNWEELF